MTDEEMYEFDLRGYIVYRNVLAPDMVSRILSIIKDVKPSPGTGKFSFFELDRIFMDLMCQRQTINVTKVLLGEWLRFDHAFGIKMSNNIAIRENLHAGQMQNQRSFWYQWGPGQIMHNGLIKVIYALNEVKPGDGGFICIPGSHKSNLPFRPSDDSPLVINPALQLGDMLVFTEALVHGSKQWTPPTPRQVLIYSYSPGFMAWKHYSTVERYLALATNDIQRDLLRPPYVGDYDERAAAQTGDWPTGRRSQVRDYSSCAEGMISPAEERL